MKLTALVAVILLGTLVAMLAFSSQRDTSTTVIQPPTPSTPMKTHSAQRTEKAAPSGPRYSKSGHDITPLTKERVEELAKKLSPGDAEVILAKGTERPFCGNLLDNKKEGVYICKLCGLPLFGSSGKFHSGTGWPSFFTPVDKDHVVTNTDNSLGEPRVEILCARCGAHLGHVFEDGPKPTGLRFCVNSASLDFVEKGQPMAAESKPIDMQTAYFAGGCFWGIEDLFQQQAGVIDSVSGYMGGKTKNPTYEDVCDHTTGHAETVKVTFDPKRITYPQLLAFFFKIHDPTQMNRQGPDVGDQYRSAIFASGKEQLEQARAFVDEQQMSNKRFAGRKIVTQIVEPVKEGPSTVFYSAEDYHQDYHVKHGGHCPMPER